MRLWRLRMRAPGAALDALEAAVGDALAVSVFAADEETNLWEIEWLLAAPPDLAGLRRQRAAAGIADPDALVMRFGPLPEGVDWVRRGLAEQPAVGVGRFRIHGSHLPRRLGGIDLTIDAGLAFGTGAHASTQGCLMAIERLARRCHMTTALDVGTGSGILALALAGLLKGAVVASDNDRQAVHTARANAGRNRLAAYVRVVAAEGYRHPAIRRGAPYDLVTMNILARPLITLAPACSRHLARGGHVVLSGITEQQAGVVAAAYRSQGLTLERSYRMGEWRTIVLVKRRRRRTGSRSGG